MLKVKYVKGIVVGLLLVAVGVVLECQCTGSICNISEFMECIIGGNMVLYINGNHILYLHMDVFRYIMLENTYFKGPDYLVRQSWINTMLLYI